MTHPGDDTLVSDLLFAAAVANLAAVRPTINLFLRPPRYFYFQKSCPGDRLLGAFLLLLAALTAGSLAALRLTRAVAPPGLPYVAAALLLAGAACGGLGLLSATAGRLDAVRAWAVRGVARRRGKVVLGLLAATAGLAAFALAGVAFPALYTAVVALSAPAVVPVACAAGALARRRRFAPVAERPPAPARPGTDPRAARVVWVVLDELDQRLGFDERPGGLELPHLDRFLSEAVACDRAVPPCRCTEISMPAFFTGRLVDETVASGPNALGLYYTGGSPPQPFALQRTLFDELRGRGVNCGVTTWYHPFSRLFGDRVVASHWEEAPTPENSVTGSVAGMAAGLARSLVETTWFSPFGPPLVVRKAVRRYESSLAAALALAADGRLGLALLHLPVPHSPFIGEAVAGPRGPRGYFGNLALADEAFGRIRAAAESAGLWDRSVVIVTSDHWWRGSTGYDGRKDVRVPFAVRFPGQAGARRYGRPVNTVVTHALILALADGSVRGPDDLIAWLDVHGADDPPTKT